MIYRILPVLAIMITSTTVSAQFGLRFKYNNAAYNDWDQSIQKSYFTDKKMLASGLEIGADYWFKLKKRRIEFMPELAYSASKTTYNQYDLVSIAMTSFHFNFNTHIYALDMEGDCNCPTFSKQGTTINKGLFFHFTPGISYNNLLTRNLQVRSYEAKSVSFKAGIGIGLDLGVSDLITLTPILSYYFSSSVPYENIDYPTVNTNPKLLQASMRVGFRPDYGRSGRRRR